MSITFPHDPRRNRILAALSPAEYERLENSLERVDLSLGEVLYEAGSAPEFVYFPVTCIVSLIFATEDGSTAELAMTGNDGLVGIPLVLGGASTTHEMVVQSAGHAYRLRAELMTRELDQGGLLQRLCLCYAQALMTEMAQSVVCNRHHTVEQQLCRWLLVSFDQLPGNQLDLTQELIANMLGVRREAVTEAAVKLQAAELIQYRRGHITITNRPGLEARACECYRTVRSEYDRLFSLLPANRPQDQDQQKPARQHNRAETCFLLTNPAKPKAPPEPDELLHELQLRQTELEQQNEELQRANAEAEALCSRYADIYDFAPVSHITLNPTGHIVDLNLTGAILLGIKRSEKKRHRFATYVKPACLPAFKQFVEEVRQTSQKRSCETILVRTAQRPETKVRIEAVPDESGQECRMVVIDLAPESMAEKALRKRELYQRTLLDKSPFMAWLKDEQGRFLAVNVPFATHFGCPSTEALIGKTLPEMTGGELPEPAWLDDSQALQRGDQLNFVAPMDGQGEQHWFETSKSSVAMYGKRRATAGFARDITERHNGFRALAASEQRCRSFVDNLPLSVAIIQDGILKYVNAKGVNLLGYTANECIGQPLLQFIHEADHPTVHAGFLHGDMDKTKPSGYAVRLTTKTGDVIDCQLNANPVEWDGATAVMGVFEDVTERKALEAELRSLATTDSLTELANRRYFLARQEEALSRLKRGIDQEAAVLMLDIDHFKDINDAFGHPAGDTVLRKFSSLLRDELRQVDIAGRMGGEEFAVLLPEADLVAAAVFAERLRQKVAGTSIMLDTQRVSITVSIGIAVMSADDARPDQVLQRADEALYRAKTLGRNRIELSDKQDVVSGPLAADFSVDKYHQWTEDSRSCAPGKIHQLRRFRPEHRQHPAS